MKFKSIFTRILTSIFLFSMISSATLVTPVSAADVKPDKLEVTALADSTDQIIIKYRAASTAYTSPGKSSQMARLKMAAGVDIAYRRPMSGNSHVLILPARLPISQIESITQKLMTLPEVEYAEPDEIAQPSLTPNDTRYADQWDLFGTWGINAPAAWDTTTGSASVVIAVLDTGITNHADLNGRILPGYDFISDKKVSNDGDGRDSDPTDPGDWCDSQGLSSSWHGTHVAGTIGAASNNSTGIAGINWTSKIVPVRVLGMCGGYNSDIADGMRWAAGLTVTGAPNNVNPAKVLNMSLGGAGLCSTTYQNAVNAVTAAGSVIVIAAGNEGKNASQYQPASCNGVITVAATDINGQEAFYSNYGATVEISAPGGGLTTGSDQILSTVNTGTTVPVADAYDYKVGTSMAAPHVTGVVSLMFSVAPQLTPSEVLQILQSTVKPFPVAGTCTTFDCGSGIVDAAAAVQEAQKHVGGVRFVVPSGGLTSGTCNTWANGCTLQYALSIVLQGEQVWVKAGTYTPDASNRNATFTLKNSVAVYGGFAGSELKLNLRNPAANITTLSGDIGTTGDTSDNSYHIVTGSGTNSNAILDGFTITLGNASTNGGGMLNDGGSPTLRNLTFSNNTAAAGGGMYNANSSNPSLSNITFSNNTSGSGAGIYNYNNSNPTLVNVTFSGNTATDYGGGMVNYESSPVIINSTFSDNSAATDSGGGMFNANSTAGPTLINTIIANSTSGGDCVQASGSLNSDSINNLIEDTSNACGLTNGVNGNIVGVDPNISVLANNGGITQTRALTIDSPALNFGANEACPEKDQREIARPYGSSCDIGAFELNYANAIRYSVPAGGKTNGACNSWANACTLQYALGLAISGDQVWVKAGTYKPHASDRNVSFTLKTGVSIYGGFAGSETSLSQRNPVSSITILSGDIGIADDHSDDSYHVVNGSSVDATGILDGFTITYGNANGASSNGNGGAIFNNNGSPTLTNLIITANSALAGGGGMRNEYNSNPVVTNVTFSNNHAGEGGGAIYNYFSDPTFTNVTFSANSTDGWGGAIVNYESSSIIINATLSNNTAAITGGGGMFNANSSNGPTLINTIIANSSNGEDCVQGSGSLNPASINNLIEDASNACGLSNNVNGNIIGLDPALGTLTGSPAYYPLNVNSPAIEAGTNTNCPSTDQRGAVRPQDSDGNNTATCDIGAYESPDTFMPKVSSIVRVDANPTAASNVNFTVTFSESVTNVAPNDFSLTTTGAIGGASISSVIGAGNTYTVTVFTGTGNGTIRLDIPVAATIVDASNNGNGLIGLPYTSGETYTINKERLINGGFNIFSGKIPTRWKAVNFSATDGKSTARKEGKYAVTIMGGLGKIKTLTQTLTLSGVAGDSFTFSYWAKGASLPKAGLCQAQVILYQGTTKKITKTLPCGKLTTTFKKKTLTFTSTSAYNKIIIKFTYSKASGTVWFDLASLIK